MSILGTLTGKQTANHKLDAQEKKLDELSELLKKAGEEVEVLRQKLVTKANGALYKGVLK